MQFDGMQLRKSERTVYLIAFLADTKLELFIIQADFFSFTVASVAGCVVFTLYTTLPSDVFPFTFSTFVSIKRHKFTDNFYSIAFCDMQSTVFRQFNLIFYFEHVIVSKFTNE